MNLDRYVKAYQNGNEKAFNILYKETYKLARSVIYIYVQNANTIEDLLQETYTKASSNIKDCQITNFRNWIYTIAKNLAIDYAKRKKEICIEEPDILPSKEKNPYLYYALDHLDKDCREVFLMKVLCGYTTKWISEALNMSIKTVNNLYYKAKDILRESLEDKDNEF